MHKTLILIAYLLSDIISSMLGYVYFIQTSEEYMHVYDVNYFAYIYLAYIPGFWLILHYLRGYYNNTMRKSRLQEFGDTISVVFIGTILYYLLGPTNYSTHIYHSPLQFFITFIAIHFSFIYFPRLIITSIVIYNIRNRTIGFPTLIVGSDQMATKIYHQMIEQKKSLGNKLLGFVNMTEADDIVQSNPLPVLGTLKEINFLVNKYKIEEIIIALEPTEKNEIKQLLNTVASMNVVIKIMPDIYDVLMGSVKMHTPFGEPLIEISTQLMPTWQQIIKRLMDIIFSLLALLLLLPAFALIAIGIKLTSRGPIIYSHERIGQYGKPFTIFKFRSMYINSEAKGPALSSAGDTRITPFGKFLRKMRLDEMPQFWNVLRGEMSLVGPRPERQYYIEQIIEIAPHYNHLQKVKPGITSWGQVKFGYAENIDEMVERLKYDLVYLETMSLYTDIKILIYTIIIVLKGKGK